MDDETKALMLDIGKAFDRAEKALRAFGRVGVEFAKSVGAYVEFYRAYQRNTHPHCAGCGRYVKAHRDKDGAVLWTDCDIHGRLGPREGKDNGNNTTVPE